MWHDVAGLIAAGEGNPSSGTPTSIVGLIIITIPAFLTAFALLVGKLPRRGRRPQDEPPAPLPLAVNPVNSNELPGAVGSKDRRRLAVIEMWMWRNRLDPTKIKRGNEAIEDVRIAE